MAAIDYLLANVADSLTKGEITLDELVTRLSSASTGNLTEPTTDRDYPTVAAHTERVMSRQSTDTARTYGTHYKRLCEGTSTLCECTCAECVDNTKDCVCACSRCRSKLRIPALADLVLRPGAVVPSDVEDWAEVAERMATKHAVVRNGRRAQRKLQAVPIHGQGGRENAVAAFRHFFTVLVKDRKWTEDPAADVSKGRRHDTVRRSLHDDEIAPFFEAVVSGGDDPELDFMLAWFHMESGARRGGAVSLTMGLLKPVTQMIELHEKNDSDASQPVSAELIDALISFAIARGGPRCDPAAPEYDETAPVLYYKSKKDGLPHPLTERRYDTLYKRIQKTLPWAKEIMLTSHCLRKTGASIVERIAGNEVARYYLRHGRRTVTQTYTEASSRRLAQAVEVLTASTHPAARHSSGS